MKQLERLHTLFSHLNLCISVRLQTFEQVCVRSFSVAPVAWAVGVFSEGCLCLCMLICGSHWFPLHVLTLIFNLLTLLTQSHTLSTHTNTHKHAYLVTHSTHFHTVLADFCTLSYIVIHSHTHSLDYTHTHSAQACELYWRSSTSFCPLINTVAVLPRGLCGAAWAEESSWHPKQTCTLITFSAHLHVWLFSSDDAVHYYLMHTFFGATQESEKHGKFLPSSPATLALTWVLLR